MKKIYNKNLITLICLSFLTLACSKKGTVLKDEQKKSSLQKPTENNANLEQSDNALQEQQKVTQKKNVESPDEVKTTKKERAKAKSSQREDENTIHFNRSNFLEKCGQVDLSDIRAKGEQLPYRFGRIDVFTRDSYLHDIGDPENPVKMPKEYMVVSLDGYVRLVGRISSGLANPAQKAINTPSRRWSIFGLWKEKWQLKEVPGGKSERESPMPWSIMLMPYTSTLDNCRYTGICIHGTSGYGQNHYGYPASHGCIRCATDHSDMALDHWTKPGLHHELWNIINPNNANNIALDDELGSVEWARRYAGWDRTTEREHDLLVEMNRKIKVYTHSDSSLYAHDDYWKVYFENLYSQEIILDSIGDMKYEWANHYKVHPANKNSELDMKELCKLYLYENWHEKN